MIPQDYSIIDCLLNAEIEEERWTYCDFFGLEMMAAIESMESQVGTDERPRPGMASLELDIAHVDRNYSMSISNQQFSSPNIDGEVDGYPGTFNWEVTRSQKKNDQIQGL